MANSTTLQTSLEGKRVRPFGIADKFGYMFGDLANGLLFLGMSIFLGSFYRDALGLNAGLVGTMMMLVKFLDAFTDFGMGRIVNAVKGTKAGKFKPWLLWLSAPVALSSFLMYQSYMVDSATWIKWVYAIITYILFNSIFYTGINIPYGSMASAIVTSPQERAQLSAWRGIGPTTASLVLGLIPTLFSKYLYKAGKLQAGPIMLITGILAIISVGFYIACYFLCTERLDLNQYSGPKLSILKSLGNIFRSKAFIILAIATVVQVVIQLATADINRYLYQVAFSESGISTDNATFISNLYQLISSAVVIVLVTPVTIQLVKKFGKRTVTIWSTLSGGVAYILLFVFGTLLRKSAWAYMISSLVPYILVGALTAITFAFINDIIDDMEIKNGTREDAPVYAMYSFVRKLSQGIAAQLGGLVLVLAGYDANKPATENIAAATPMYNTLTIGFGVGFIVIGLLFLFFYPLTKKKVEENAKILMEKRERLNAAKLADATVGTVSTETVSLEEAASLEAAELIINNEELHNKNMADTDTINTNSSNSVNNDNNTNIGETNTENKDEK